MKKIITVVLLLVGLFAYSTQFSSAESKLGKEPWSKYPDNSKMDFKDVDSFYEALDTKYYSEFTDAKLNIREKTYFKDINKVLSKADKYGDETRINGDGYHPQRQVYVFVTVSGDGKKMITAIYDAETKDPLQQEVLTFERKIPYNS